jgi:hypothetical protein
MIGSSKHHVKVSSRFEALEDLDDEVNINSAWETIRENTKISAKESTGYYGLSSISHDSRKDAKIIRSKKTS